MKAYIIYIATLLAALTLPANGQNSIGTTGTDTKAAPDVPAMPYRLSMTLIGGAHGKPTVAATKPGGDKDIYLPLTADSLIYGAPDNSDYSPGKNAAEVKISVVLDKFYKLRDGYPKVYPTGKPDKFLQTSGNDDANGNPYRTFRMPSSPVTVEMAYALPIDSLIPISLQAPAADITAALALLPKYVPMRLADGRKDSLKVAGTNGWVLHESSFNSKVGAVNEFKVYFAIPDSLREAPHFNKADDGVHHWYYIKVSNKAESLKPEDAKDKEIVISGGTGDNLNGNTGTDGTDQAFNGTIEDADVKSLEIGSDVKDATLTLKDVTVSGGDDATKAKTEVKSGADLTIKVEGKSDLGTLTVEEGAAVVLTKSEGATLKVTEVANAGSFRDSTATITTVTGPGALTINAALTGGSTVTPNTKVTLTASTNDKAGTTTFIWQQQNADGSYTEVSRQAYDADGKPAVLTKADTAPTGIVDTYEPATASTGTVKYRCLIERTAPAGDSSEKPATTLLSTQPASVVVKSGSDPVVPSTYYTVTLPALEGFTSTPAAGKHSVEEGNSFSFSLTPKAGNTDSAPVVTTSRGETIKPRPADGKYVITGIYEDITISFASTPTANEAFGTESISIGTSSGQLNVRTPLSTTVTVYTLSGHSIRKLDIPAGDSTIKLPAGFYIVTVGNQKQKVIIR